MKLGKPLVTALKGNVSDEIQLYASSAYSNNEPWYMFDGNLSTRWDSYSDKSPVFSVTFKKAPVIVQGLSITRYAYNGRNDSAEVYYWDKDTKAYVLIDSFNMASNVQNIQRLFKKSVKTETIKINFKTANNDVQLAELQLHGIVAFNIIKMNNQYYTIKNGEVQTLSDFNESNDYFMSKGFTIDELNSNVLQTLKNMGQMYSILTTKGD